MLTALKKFHEFMLRACAAGIAVNTVMLVYNVIAGGSPGLILLNFSSGLACFLSHANISIHLEKENDE